MNKRVDNTLNIPSCNCSYFRLSGSLFLNVNFGCEFNVLNCILQKEWIYHCDNRAQCQTYIDNIFSNLIQSYYVISCYICIQGNTFVVNHYLQIIQRDTFNIKLTNNPFKNFHKVVNVLH